MASPLEKYNIQHKARWDILVDFPAWEKNSILHWVKLVVHKRGYDEWGNAIASYNPAVLLDIQKSERIMLRSLGIDISSWSHLDLNLRKLVDTEPEKVVLLIELLVGYIRDTKFDHESHSFGSGSAKSDYILGYLENLLANGSKWTVVSKKHASAGLMERVSPQLMESAENMHNNDLDNAWHHAFGPGPQPDQAITYAQSAIEHMASRAGLTSAVTQVYGTLLGDIKRQKGDSYLSIAKPEFDKAVSLTKKRSDSSMAQDVSIDNEFADWFWSGMDIIQKSNPTRHKSDKVENFTVSIDAARQAVLIATVLCELITNKYIYRKNTTPKP